MPENDDDDSDDDEMGDGGGTGGEEEEEGEEVLLPLRMDTATAQRRTLRLASSLRILQFVCIIERREEGRRMW